MAYEENDEIFGRGSSYRRSDCRNILCDQKYFNKDESEDFDEEEFEDVFADEVDDREYVTLDIDGNEMEGNESEEDAEDDAE